MSKSEPPTTLADRLRQSESDPFLLAGPAAPHVGWVYRDFRLMPQSMWLQLLDLIGDENIKVVAVNSRQIPPAPMCRAQLWISPAGQARWTQYLTGTVQ